MPSIRQALASVTVLLLVSSATVAPAGATFAACRADPVVTLSNGMTIDLYLSINDTLSDIARITYTLHGPTGTRLIAVSYPDGTAAISSVTYVADDTLGNYDGDTVVTTRTHTSTMTAYLSPITLPAGSGAATPAAPAQGHSGQDLHIHLHVA